MSWICKKCGKIHGIVEEVKLVQQFILDKDLNQEKMVATGGYGGEYEFVNRFYKCRYCGANVFSDIEVIAKWEDKA